MGEAEWILLDNILSCQYFPSAHIYLGPVREALRTPSACGWFTTFFESNTKAKTGAPLADEARRALCVGRADP